MNTAPSNSPETSMKICVVDCETTGLNPDAGHEIWEIGLIIREQADLTDPYTAHKDTEYLWRIKPDLTKADPEALRKNRFYERTDGMVLDPSDDAANLAGLSVDDHDWSDPAEVAGVLAFQLDNGIVVGANPGFDIDFIRPFLHRHGQAYTAHYRPICVTTFAAGFLFGKAAATSQIASGEVDLAFVPESLNLPWSSNAISGEVGVNADDYDRHTALDDCRWALAQLDAVMGGGDRG